jgi:hypothetical protein
MPSISDVYNELTQVNARLLQLHNDLASVKASTDGVKTSVDQVNSSLVAAFGALGQTLGWLITLQEHTNKVLGHHAQQNDTIMCILEKVSERTCHLLNESHSQTFILTSVEASSTILVELYKTAHADAALEQERLGRLHKQLLECCPREEPKPVCKYEPCKPPPSLEPPPVRPADYG